VIFLTVSELDKASGEIFDLEREFNGIYDSTYSDIYKYVLSKARNIGDIDDIVQNIYINFYNRLKKGVEIKEPVKYLVKTAKHEVYKNYRVFDRLAKHVPVFSKSEDENYDNFELELLNEEKDEISGLILEEVWKFLKSGDVMTYKIFVLYFEYEEKLCDIAKILAVKESTVKNRLFRTLKIIREKYDV
jgi:RNA polymerase sigma-70 factor (ECF subfamily)